MFAKLKNSLNATKFEFCIHVHTLQPWPAGNKAIAIGWQRGKKRKGATRSVYPASAPGKLGCAVRPNESFTLSATLYKATGIKNNKSPIGPFKKKCLILAILETDGRTNATAALGRVVIDLSEYASIDGQELRTFHVACNKAIHAAVGDPQLTVTIRCRWKKAGASFSKDDIMSMSTDTTGSQLTTNLNSLLRLRFDRAASPPTNEEQDLQGFEKNYMEAIEEGEGEEETTSGKAAGARGAAGGSAAAGAATNDGLGSHPVVSHGPDAQYDEDGFLRDSDEETPAAARSPTAGSRSRLAISTKADPLPLATSSPPAAAGAATGAAVAATAAAAAVAPAQQQQQQQPSSPSAFRSRWRLGSAKGASSAGAGGATSPTRAASAGSPTASGGADQQAQLKLDEVTKALTAELLSAAAIEMSLYVSHLSLNSTGLAPPSRRVHAPARRIARTLVSMDQGEGLAFGASTLKLLRSLLQSAAKNDDMAGLGFWYSNIVHLRAMLQGLPVAGTGAATNGVDSPKSPSSPAAVASPSSPTGSTASVPAGKHWASRAFVRELVSMERWAYEHLLAKMWEDVLLPAVGGPAPSGARAASASGGSGPSTPTKAAAAAAAAPTPPPPRRAMQEAAVRRWLEAFDLVNSQMAPMAGDGHGYLLKSMVLVQCLKRVDALLFHYLLATQKGMDLLSEYTADTSLWGGKGVPLLDEGVPLPMPRSTLTFGAGMSVKMAVTRLQQWAFGEGVLRDIWGNMTELLGEDVQFPLLKGAADLLMMPKELLMDEAIRADMTSSLSLRSVLHILENFTPDEFAHDTISPSILAAVKEDTKRRTTADSSASGATAAGAGGGARDGRFATQLRLACRYHLPSETKVMEPVDNGEEPGLEYDADSEAELEAVSALTSPALDGSVRAARFGLLHSLWVTRVPRKRAVGVKK